MKSYEFAPENMHIQETSMSRQVSPPKLEQHTCVCIQ